MNRAFLQELSVRRAEVARRWKAHLKDARVYTALGNPDTLAFMIEPTLTQLFRNALERATPSWAPQSPPRVRLVDSVSRCALNPMIGYYLAGEAAITAVIHEIPPNGLLTGSEILVSMEELLAFLRSLGKADVTGFCEICLIETPTSATTEKGGMVPLTCPFKATTHTHAPTGGQDGR